MRQEFEDYLKCGRLEYGFLRVKCEACRHEHLVAFSCKRRGFCPSCGARRIMESAAHLVDHVFPDAPVRQWVLTFPYPLRFLFAAQPQVLCQVLRIVYRGISTFLIRRSGFHRARRPSTADLVRLLDTLSRRVTRLLERQGLLIRDPDSPYLELEPGSRFDQRLGAGSDPLARRVRAQLQAPGPDRAAQTSGSSGHRQAQSSNDLDATPQAGVRFWPNIGIPFRFP